MTRRVTVTGDHNNPSPFSALSLSSNYSQIRQLLGRHFAMQSADLLHVPMADISESDCVASLYLELLNKVNVDVALEQLGNIHYLSARIEEELKAPETLRKLLDCRIVYCLCSRLKVITSLTSSASEFDNKVSHFWDISQLDFSSNLAR